MSRSELASLINLPCIGVANNTAYATGQANVASAKRPPKPTKTGRKVKGPSLVGDMGFFGGAHEDMKDDPGHFSHMRMSGSRKHKNKWDNGPRPADPTVSVHNRRRRSNVK
ncbi:hypothetical protein B0H10DRAFT_2070938 [Mycena sp. CBHHK59/15]|nr:hypothetical protein B0H10DRAFT_2070938 [Mycena sp. CBHHK59/15]